jgi:hypothetical protein
MREQFPWFFDPTEEELQRLWDEATFAFDANVLLNLYRVDRETTEDYFKIFQAFGDRIFLPHEAANQFFHNRRGVIRTEQNSFSKAKDEVEKWVERRTSFENLKQQLRGGNIGQIIEDEIESVFDGRGDYEEEVEEVKDDLIERIEDLQERFTPTGTTRANAEEDEILDELMEIFDGKTGEPLDEDMEDLKEKAQERYESEKPPGYEDYDGEDELGRGECEDYLIWKQLMDFAEREGEDFVFITSERKEDWWEVDEAYNPVRPRHELMREFGRKTEQVFWMLTTEQMFGNAHKRMGIDVKNKSVKQAEKVSSENFKMGKGREYYMEEKEMKIQRIRNPILEARKRIYQLRDALDKLKNNPKKYKKENVRRHISLLESSIVEISDRHDYLDEVKINAIKMNSEEIRRSIYERNIDEALGLSEKLKYHIDDITESMEAKIKEVYG